MSCDPRGQGGGFPGRNQWREPAHPFRHRGVWGPPADDAPRSLKRCHGHAPFSRRTAHGTASGVRSAGGDVSARFEGRCPFGAGLSCSAPSPGGAGSRPLRASIPIAGAPPASRRFAERLITRSPLGRAQHEHALPEVPETGTPDPARRRCAATVRRRARQGSVTGPCRPARRSPGAARRRPTRAPPGIPCP